MSRDFSWHEDTDAVVIPRQSPVAVYLNVAGEVVIRQEGYPYDDEDDVIVIAVVNAKTVADAIMARAAESRAAHLHLVQTRGERTESDEPKLPLDAAE